MRALFTALLTLVRSTGRRRLLAQGSTKQKTSVQALFGVPPVILRLSNRMWVCVAAILAIHPCPSSGRCAGKEGDLPQQLREGDKLMLGSPALCGCVKMHTSPATSSTSDPLEALRY
ncbi:unnamed protein product [Discosporangium mesarthrocarpum]